MLTYTSQRLKIIFSEKQFAQVGAHSLDIRWQVFQHLGEGGNLEAPPPPKYEYV